MHTNPSQRHPRGAVQSEHGHRENPVLSDCDIVVHLLENQHLTPEAMRRALGEWGRRQPPLGEMACRARVMSMAQVFAVLDEQASTQELFGEIAVRLGFFTSASLRRLLAEQSLARPELLSFLHETGWISDTVRAEVENSLAHGPRPGFAVA
jgi:hypothetical protein